FEGFDLRQTVEAARTKGAKPNNREPELETRWLDDRPRLAVDRNGIPIILHIPNWHRKKSLRFNDLCLKLAEKTPPTPGDSADGGYRNSPDAYQDAEGEVSGRIKLVTCWHAIGHPNDAPVPSSSVTGSGRKFAVATTALSDFKLIAKRLNKILEVLDPGAASQYLNLRQTAMDKVPYLRAFDAVDPSYWQGRMILFNSQTPAHTDNRCPPPEWTPLHAAGTFTEGGCFYAHDLKLRMRYLPGDLIFLRGYSLSHSVKPWKGGQRISVVYFTHESVWQHFDCVLTL
ncbi:hypothetical protein BJ322DRAFT_1012744, partial [Thelephora terrestris]